MSHTTELPPSQAGERAFYLSDEQIEELTNALVSALDDTFRFLSDSAPAPATH
ncbi:hypothetical protein [Pararhizobium arenae]|uniref:hypothetical protein n=1 Tax=Pararhizobium arenae TaxID=1856850 RepID=UPI000B23ACB4|nr:hypothetical protein [Pararhizobium arenae]